MQLSAAASPYPSPLKVADANISGHLLAPSPLGNPPCPILDINKQ